MLALGVAWIRYGLAITIASTVGPDLIPKLLSNTVRETKSTAS